MKAMTQKEYWKKFSTDRLLKIYDAKKNFHHRSRGNRFRYETPDCSPAGEFYPDCDPAGGYGLYSHV